MHLLSTPSDRFHRCFFLLWMTAFLTAGGLASEPAFGQDARVVDSSQGLRPWRLTGIMGATGATWIGLHIHQRNAWWADQRTDFHFQNDWRYALWADKMGHAWAGQFITRLYDRLFRWSGLEHRTALWGGAGMGLVYLLYVEYQDGFGAQWGFSPGDALFDAVGALYPVAQSYVPALRPFTLKVSYWPTGTPDKIFFDDYTGQTYWYTVNLHSILPDDAKRFAPPWLNLTLGYAARKPDPNNFEFLSERHFFIGLDLEPLGLPIKGPLWERLSDWLHLFHFPAPALRLTPSVKFLVFAY